MSDKYPKVIKNFTAIDIEKIHGRAEETLFKKGELNNENWSTASFYHCRFEEVSFDLSLMQNISFFSNIFTKSNSFKESTLSGVNFNSSILESVSFIGADISGCNFFKASLEGCDFRNTQIEGCNFWDTDLSYCNFEGADLSLCELRNVRNLFGAKYDKRTKLPFSKEEARKYGMILTKGSHLAVVGEIITSAKIISFDQNKKLKQKSNYKNQVNNENNVIKISEYFKTSNGPDDGGPQIA